ncbi:MAG: flavodoxin-dependent (E)-4-hydroxy-3-methylbut-2-enyl-diphosphate synthase [Lentisphaerae bacterium]|nr:flavodoxin-dependent (E)-4-hydroxy-3-methylbut-2-enyl-diphosphate synthase [Lentisphaerota bacterium]
MSERRLSRQVNIGRVKVGGDAPVSVQTMTKTDTRDIDATVSQIREIMLLGCDIIRLAVVDEAAAEALKEIKRQVDIPLIADIHFDHKLALASLRAGVDGLRINPGNIGERSQIRQVVDAARDRKVPIRIGVNSGSLEKDIESEFGNTAEALVRSAMRHVEILESMDYHEIKISVKSSDVQRTIEAYRLLSLRCDYPLHLGVTEAGTFMAGTVRSCVGMGVLLESGIGDTIRVSLSDTPVNEVRVGLELLRSLGLKERGASVVSCPTCGRTEVDVVSVARELEAVLESYFCGKPSVRRPLVAVMGCMVNGPGEARGADIAIAGGKGKFVLYVEGRSVGTVPESGAVEATFRAVRDWCERA